MLLLLDLTPVFPHIPAFFSATWVTLVQKIPWQQTYKNGFQIHHFPTLIPCVSI